MNAPDAVNNMYRAYGKRILDIFAAGFSLLALSPFMLAIALLIVLDDGFPVIYRQDRVGKNGVVFRMLKFRSMKKNSAVFPSAMGRDLAITRVGRVIRRTNMDELPQLFNILRGDMSIVGPRPAIEMQKSLLDLRRRSGAIKAVPGLTGLAQVSSYNGMPEREKASFDAQYCETISFVNDARIVLRTVGYLSKPPPVY